MTMPSTIRLLAQDNNQRGDLFTRLIKDLFFALGYDDLQLDVHKTGRELDIQGQHRHEPRRVVAECKAHQKKMGGAELNKFLGVLTRERGRTKDREVAGYFVSLGGFAGSAREQEQDSDHNRVILLDAENVIAELARSKVLIGLSEAYDKAGECRQICQHGQAGPSTSAECDGAELLGTRLGYVWAIFYAHNKQRSHFALIHADGTPLAQEVADSLLAEQTAAADPTWAQEVRALTYLAPAPHDQAQRAVAAAAAKHYRTWLAEECGYMQLDGLPTDADLGASRPKLERLFVPLKARSAAPPPAQAQGGAAEEDAPTAEVIGALMGKFPHLALLAAPGGGKSTLLKRLATAYAMPERLPEVADDLPQRAFLPLLLRCRDLRQRAREPILALLHQLAQAAAMSGAEAGAFQSNVDEALRSGKVLLLIDGLDELSNEADRVLFSQNLRTFIGMFPTIHLLLTSREAGFRLVAGVIAGVCQQATLAPLDELDVKDLCLRWHSEVYGDKPDIQQAATSLAQTIWANERIRKLAENPLLLTTLLVVKRSTRELPRKRADLYRAAINVLVKTWNTEGYDAMDEDETLAQLSYIACAMMAQGIQRIGGIALLKLLQTARKELEEELRNTSIAPAAFIQRIELRSSLLMQTGHEEIDEQLQPVYEFRHLTFQEYLTARGLVEEQYPGRRDAVPLEELLANHFNDEGWREVVPLAAVLAKRKAEKLVKCLVEQCELLEWAPGETPNVVGLLAQCVADQVQISTDTLQKAYQQMGRHYREASSIVGPIWLEGMLADDKDDVFRQAIENSFLMDDMRCHEYFNVMSGIAQIPYLGANQPTNALAKELTGMLAGQDVVLRINAALACMRLAFDGLGAQAGADAPAFFAQVVPGLYAMVRFGGIQEKLVASWAMVWIGEKRLIRQGPPPEIMLTWAHLWQSANHPEQARFFAWALRVQKLLPRDTFLPAAWGDCDAFLQAQVKNERDEIKLASLVLMWYRRGPLSDAELVAKVSKLVKDDPFADPPFTAWQLLANLGTAGLAALAELEASTKHENIKQAIQAARRVPLVNDDVLMRL